MTREQKARKFNEIVGYDLNVVKDKTYRVVERLEDSGFMKEAEQLMNLIYKIEAFQNKY